MKSLYLIMCDSLMKNGTSSMTAHSPRPSCRNWDHLRPSHSPAPRKVDNFAPSRPALVLIYSVLQDSPLNTKKRTWPSELSPATCAACSGGCINSVETPLPEPFGWSENNPGFFLTELVYRRCAYSARQASIPRGALSSSTDTWPTPQTWPPEMIYTSASLCCQPQGTRRTLR